MGRIVIDLLGVHRTEDANLVRDPANVRKEFRDFLTALTPLLEFTKRAARLQFRVLQLSQLLAFGERLRERLAVEFLELGLVIETFQMRRPARHAEVNDALGPHRKMGRVDRPFPAGGGGRRRGRAQQLWIEQTGKRQAAQAESRATEKGAAVDV